VRLCGSNIWGQQQAKHEVVKLVVHQSLLVKASNLGPHGNVTTSFLKGLAIIKMRPSDK
jgi:hypothetical protein